MTLPTLPNLSAERAAFAAYVAKRLLLTRTVRFTRTFEKVSLRPGVITRAVEASMLLPTADGPLNSLNTGADLSLCLPLWTMRRGQLLSDLRARVNGRDAEVVGRRQSILLSTAVLASVWSQARSAIAPILNADQLASLVALIEPNLQKLVGGRSVASRDVFNQITRALRRNNVIALPGVKRFLGSAKFMTRRYLLWIEALTQPGSPVRIEYSYTTRFAPEYGSLSPAPPLLRRSYGRLKRWVGQEPSDYYIPISRQSLTESYHFQMDAPPRFFMEVFEFADQASSGPSAQSFKARCLSAGADIEGDQEVGGPFGHLYCHSVPYDSKVRVLVHAKVGERPPGSSASVLTLNLLMFLAAGYVFSRGAGLALNTASAAAFALAVPGVVALWFSHIFQAEGRANLPFITRLSLWASTYGSLCLVALFVFPSLQSDHPDILIHPLDSTRRWLFGALVVTPLGASLGLIFWHRIRAHLRYRELQRRALSQYGL